MNSCGWRLRLISIFVAVAGILSLVPIMTKTVCYQMAIFGIVYVAIATAVHASIVMLAAELRPWLVEGPRQNVVRRGLAVALVFVAGWLFWATKR